MPILLESWSRPSFWFTRMVFLFTLQREKKSQFSSSFIRTLISPWGPHPLDLITSYIPPPITITLALQHMNLCVGGGVGVQKFYQEVCLTTICLTICEQIVHKILIGNLCYVFVLSYNFIWRVVLGRKERVMIMNLVFIWASWVSSWKLHLYNHI